MSIAAGSLRLAAAAGAAAGLAALPLMAPAAALASAVLAALMLAIAAEDVRRLVVPDVLVVAAALAGLAATAWTVAGSGGNVRDFALLAGLGAALGGGAFWLLREAYYRLRGVDGLGLGDVKLAAAAGVWLGHELIGVAVLVAAGAALVAVAAHTARRGRWPADRPLPFAAFLAPSVWAVWFVERAGLLL